MVQPYVDTPLRAACPVVDAALREFGDSLRSARLLRLAPGGCIREHRDYGLSIENGELASQLRQAGGFLVPGVLDRVGGAGTAEALPGHTVGERVAGLLHATCDAARAALPGGRGLLVNYAELPEAFTGRHRGALRPRSR